MNTEKKNLSKAKKCGFVLLLTIIYACCITAMAALFRALPYSTIDTSVSSLPIINIKTALMALNDKPMMFAIIFAFAAAVGLLHFYLSKKYKISVLFCPGSTALSFILSIVPLSLGRPEIFVLGAVFFISLLPFIIIPYIPAKKQPLRPFRFFVCIILSFAILTSSFVVTKNYIKYKIGEPDRTGSWSAINQEVKRGNSWKQIVKNSKFQLGEIETITEDDVTDYYQSIGTYPALDGSTVCVPMAMEFARQHLGFDDESCGDFTNFSTTHYAYEKLIYKQTSDNYYYNRTSDIVFIKDDYVDLILATEPSKEELELAKKYGVTLVKKPICCDAFVFITHKDNPVESLTIKQIQDIYSGKITNWKQVGGNDEKIKAFQREENSGSQTAMENLVMGGRNMIDPIKVAVVEGMGELVDEVAEYRNEQASLGYTYRYYIDTLYKNDNIKTIAIDGVQPTDENIRSGKYPFSTNYYGVIRGGDEDKTGGKFLDWMLSDEGQRCIEQAGYVPIK